MTDRTHIQILEDYVSATRRGEDPPRPNKGDYSGWTLAGAQLEGALLRRAIFQGANLRGANLRSADLMGADLSGADLEDANLEGANLFNADLTGCNMRGIEIAVPVVKDLDAKILAQGNLSMDFWHTDCGTTHCRAGWAIELAGEAGKRLEEKYGSAVAGALIYFASTGSVPDFFATNEEAIADMQARNSD